MNWVKYLVKLPLVVTGISGIIGLVKGVDDQDRKEAIKAAIMNSVSLAEFGAEKDLLNEENVSKLFDALVDAELAVSKAREALKAGILAAKPQ